MDPNLPALPDNLNDVPMPGAVLSPNREYRHLLTRDLLTPFERMERQDGMRGGADDWTLLFIMLNPSTADATVDDNTIRRCMDFGRRWGYTRMWVCNLSPFRATDPQDLKRHGPDPLDVIDANLQLVGRAVAAADRVVVAWGAHGNHNNRATEMRWLLKKTPTWCLGVTERGEPRHPLMVRADTVLCRYPRTVVL